MGDVDSARAQELLMTDYPRGAVEAAAAVWIT